MDEGETPPVGEETTMDESDPIDVFLTQPDFEEEPGLDDVALERQRLQRPRPDTDAIVEAVELLNEHHPFA